MRVVITRPRPQAEALAAILAERGVESVIVPVIEIVPRRGAKVDLDGVQAILVTSTNGADALAAAEPRRDLPVYAVGAATAETLRGHGYQQVISADGDAEALVDVVRAQLDPAGGALVHASGSEVAADLPAVLEGFEVRRAVLYDANQVSALAEEARRGIESATVDAVLLYSPRAAAGFVELATAAGVAAKLRTVDAVCLSQAVADAASAAPWRDIRVSPRPDQPALIETLLARRHEPQPPAPRPRRGSLLATAMATVALILALTALAALWRADLLIAVPEEDPAVVALRARLDSLERSLRTVAAAQVEEERVAAVESALAALMDDPSADELAAAVANLERRLAAIARPDTDEPGPTVDGLRLRVAELEADLEAARAAAIGVEHRLSDLEAQVERADATAPALLLAIGQLRDAVNAGMPFAEPLAAVAALGGPALSDTALAALGVSADSGIPTREMLRHRFPSVARAVLEADTLPADGVWHERAMAELRGLVTVRRVGPDVEGDDPGAIVARAEARLEGDDLAGAVAALQELDAAAAAAASQWLADARARLAAERAVAALTADTLAQLAPGSNGAASGN